MEERDYAQNTIHLQIHAHTLSWPKGFDFFRIDTLYTSITKIIFIEFVVHENMQAAKCVDVATPPGRPCDDTCLACLYEYR